MHLKSKQEYLAAGCSQEEEDDPYMDGTLSGMDLDEERYSQDVWNQDLEQD